ncbi:hypothetical protein NQZ79_g7573 [Umbelopsis isabellina]|nr:hypothetical protein NQZ79_g7573 [Umbelopsis isabellina]
MMKFTILVLMLCMLLGTVFCWNEGYDHEHEHEHEHEHKHKHKHKHEDEGNTITVTDFVTATVTTPVTDFITTTVTATPSTCPNTQTACGNNGVCTDCTNGGASPNLVCSNGVCTCPNTDNACSSVANCGACGGSTPNCVNNTCTCANISSACTNGGLGPNTCSACTDPNQICNAGNCCLPGGNLCTGDGDCCSGACNGGVCLSALGCGEFGAQVVNPAVFIADDISRGNPYTPTACLDFCQPKGAAYFSLFYAIPIPGYICYCYSAAYAFTPITPADNKCIVVEGYQYGLNTGADIEPPESEYVYIV